MLDECCMKIILLVITDNFLSGSFRFVGALKSICFCIPPGFAVMSLGTVYLKTLQQFPFLHGNFSQQFPYRRSSSLSALMFFCPVSVHHCAVQATPKQRQQCQPWTMTGTGAGRRCFRGGGPSVCFAFSPPPKVKQ